VFAFRHAVAQINSLQHGARHYQPNIRYFRCGVERSLSHNFCSNPYHLIELKVRQLLVNIES